jgi:hypothetical protein
MIQIRLCIWNSILTPLSAFYCFKETVILSFWQQQKVAQEGRWCEYLFTWDTGQNSGFVHNSGKRNGMHFQHRWCHNSFNITRLSPHWKRVNLFWSDHNDVSMLHNDAMFVSGNLQLWYCIVLRAFACGTIFVLWAIAFQQQKLQLA